MQRQSILVFNEKYAQLRKELLVLSRNLKFLTHFLNYEDLEEAIRLAYTNPAIDTVVSRQMRAAETEALIKHYIEINDREYLIIQNRKKDNELKEFFAEIALKAEYANKNLVRRIIENNFLQEKQQIQAALAHQIKLLRDSINSMIEINNNKINYFFKQIQVLEEEKTFHEKIINREKETLHQKIDLIFEDVKKSYPNYQREIFID